MAAKRRHAGRKTLLTPELSASIVSGIAQGDTLRAAAEYAGIGQSTLHQWLSKGREGLEPYSQFLEEVTRADAEFRRELIASLREAGKGTLEKCSHCGSRGGDWRASESLLKSRYHKDFGNRTQVKIEVERAVEDLLESIEPLISRRAMGEVYGALARLKGLAAQPDGETPESAEPHTTH